MTTIAPPQPAHPHTATYLGHKCAACGIPKSAWDDHPDCDPQAAAQALATPPAGGRVTITFTDGQTRNLPCYTGEVEDDLLIITTTPTDSKFDMQEVFPLASVLKWEYDR